MSDVQEISPLAALAASGDTPRASDTMAKPDPASAAAPASAPGMVDDAGIPFDRARHQVDAFDNPKRTSKGLWAKKTGNGARKLAGKPTVTNGLIRGASRPAPVQEVPPAAAAAPNVDTFVPPPPADGLPDDDAKDAIPAPELLTPEMCRATATGVTDGAIAIARMAGGDHWQASAVERNQLIDSLSRLWAVYNLPRFGPLVELVMVLVSFVVNGEKRREDLKRLWSWSMGKKRIENEPKEVQQ